MKIKEDKPLIITFITICFWIGVKEQLLPKPKWIPRCSSRYRWRKWLSKWVCRHSKKCAKWYIIVWGENLRIIALFILKRKRKETKSYWVLTCGLTLVLNHTTSWDKHCVNAHGSFTHTFNAVKCITMHHHSWVAG